MPEYVYHGSREARHWRSPPLHATPGPSPQQYTSSQDTRPELLSLREAVMDTWSKLSSSTH